MCVSVTTLAATSFMKQGAIRFFKICIMLLCSATFADHLCRLDKLSIDKETAMASFQEECCVGLVTVPITQRTHHCQLCFLRHSFY